MNYDDHITGLHDSNSPINREENRTPFELLMEELNEESQNLIYEEIYFRDAKIKLLSLMLRKIREEIEKLSELTERLDNKYVHNKINEIKKY